MKELRVYGGCAVLARISERLGLRWVCDVFGIDTVRGLGGWWYSEAAIFWFWYSNSMDIVNGDDAVEEGAEGIRIAGETLSFREFMTLLCSCLYTLRAVFLLWLSKPSQEQNWAGNWCASLGDGAQGSVEPSDKRMAWKSG